MSSTFKALLTINKDVVKTRGKKPSKIDKYLKAWFPPTAMIAVALSDESWATNIKKF